MFSLKEKHLDRLNGFAFAILLAMPVIRNDIITLPGPAVVLPAFILLLTAAIRLFNYGTVKFSINSIGYFYFVLLLFLYLLLSGFWHSFGLSLTQDIIKIIFIVFVSTSVILTFNLRAAEHFVNWVIFFSVISTILLISYYVQAASLRGFGIGNYLTRAQLIGVGALACYSKLLFYPSNHKKLYLFLTGLLFLGLALSLARAAFLTGVVLAVFITLFYFHTHKAKSYTLTEWFFNKSTRILSFVFVGLVIIVAFQVERTADRLRRLLGGSIGARQDLWENSVIGFLEAPIIGYGLGSSGMVSFDSATYYPHNLYLQVLIDGGIIAFLLLLSITIFPLIYAYRLYMNGYLTLKTYIWIPIITCYSFLLLEFAKSSNFYDARVFIALGIVSVIIIDQLRRLKTK